MFGRLKAMLGSRSKKAAAAAGLVGVFGVISISTTQVVGPNQGAPEFPTLESVGPASEPTVTYSGDCNFDASDDGLLIENRIVDCDTDGLRFAAGNYTVTFTNSVILGQMFTFQYTPGDAGADTYPRDPVFVVEDSEIHQLSTANAQDRAACCSHYVIRRSLIEGTHSGIGAHNNVVIEGNFITTNGTDTHSSGMRVLKNTTVDNNTVTCKPAYAGTDGGCSAAGVYYSEDLGGNSAAAFNLTITDNYFRRGTVGETGTVSGPYNATRFIDCENRVDCVDLTFTGNQFDLGWGVDADEFPLTYGGNVWANNTWTDGQEATSGQVR